MPDHYRHRDHHDHRRRELSEDATITSCSTCSGCLRDGHCYDGSLASEMKCTKNKGTWCPAQKSQSSTTTTTTSAGAYTPGEKQCDARNISVCLKNGSLPGSQECKKHATGTATSDLESMCCSFALYSKQTNSYPQGSYPCQSLRPDGKQMYEVLREMGNPGAFS